MAATATRNSPTLQISAAQLALAVAVQLIIVAVSIGGLFQRVAAQERITAPIAAGEMAKLDERTIAIQRDVAWIRSRLDKADRP
ncbi:hypothetical protein [Brevundimonas nasdae]|uniref:hypothetical protein n=1 Tax=Brevundimonas nasdae TaxID=172043 RepID=UPI00289D1055|nr:hypothetical protein [Brevundimonas nasdae]